MTSNVVLYKTIDPIQEKSGHAVVSRAGSSVGRIMIVRVRTYQP